MSCIHSELLGNDSRTNCMNEPKFICEALNCVNALFIVRVYIVIEWLIYKLPISVDITFLILKNCSLLRILNHYVIYINFSHPPMAYCHPYIPFYFHMYIYDVYLHICFFFLFISLVLIICVSFDVILANL